jgi:hypothetical protein
VESVGSSIKFLFCHFAPVLQQMRECICAERLVPNTLPTLNYIEGNLEVSPDLFEANHELIVDLMLIAASLNPFPVKLKIIENN